MPQDQAHGRLPSSPTILYISCSGSANEAFMLFPKSEVWTASSDQLWKRQRFVVVCESHGRSLRFLLCVASRSYRVEIFTVAKHNTTIGNYYARSLASGLLSLLCWTHHNYTGDSCWETILFQDKSLAGYSWSLQDWWHQQDFALYVTQDQNHDEQ